MELQESIDHWYMLADEEEQMISLGLTCGFEDTFKVRADMYRRAAKSLEIKRDTGIAVCSCHFKPFGGVNCK